MAAQLMGAWDEYAVESHEYVHAGPYVVAEQLLRGRNKHGLTLDRHWSVFTFTNGKGVTWRFYQTCDEALEAVGLRDG